MEILAQASEQEMVWSFLKAEIDSPRFQKPILAKLEADRRNRSIVDAPDLESQSGNQYRSALLDGRGYRDRTLLFWGFPHDVKWSRASLSEAAFEKVRYGNWPAWNQFSNGTRRPVQAAENFRQGRIASGIIPHIFGTIRRMVAGERLAPIILVGESLASSEFVLLEGHVRATSFLLAGGRPIDALVGVSAGIRQWPPFRS